MLANELKQRQYARPCLVCKGEVVLFKPCVHCSGTGHEQIRCRECFTWLPSSEFVVGARVVQRCHACRHRKETPATPRREIKAPNGLRVKFNLVSNNRKTGPIPVSMSSPDTCPPSCPWLGNGCYAEQHFVALHWRRMGKATCETLSWGKFVLMVYALPSGQIWRHNEAGDLPGEGDAIDWRLLRGLVNAAAKTRGFTYTHKPVLGCSEVATANREIIREENTKKGMVINLSADGVNNADDLCDLEIGPVTVVLPEDTPAKLRTPKGRPITVCPAILRENMSCLVCKLCAMPGRKIIIGFPAHGDMRKRMSTELVQLRLPL